MEVSKRHCICLLLAYLCPILTSLVAQTVWTSDHGPYYTIIDDYGVGMVGSQLVLYAADSTENSLMKSEDGGENWTHVLSVGWAVQSVAVCKSNADIVYAGVKNGSAPEGGVYKSVDGGRTWDHLSGPTNKRVTRIAIHPTNTDTVLVGCSPATNSSVFFMSFNGGANWSAIDLGNNSMSVSDIAISGDYVWVSGYGASSGNGGVWRSSNMGQSWQQRLAGMTENFEILSLAIDPSNSNVLYAGTGVVNQLTPPPRKIYKTTTAKDTCIWTSKHTVSSSQQYGFSDLRVSPVSSNTVYASTGFRDAIGIGVLKSADGGENWSVLENGILQKRLLALEVDLSDSNVLWTGGKGAHYKSTDGGASWVEKNTGFIFPKKTSLAKNGPVLLSTGSDYIYGSTDNAASWQVTDWIPMFDVEPRNKTIAFDPNDGTYALASVIVDAPGVIIYRTTNSGKTWTGIGTGSGYTSALAFQGASSTSVYCAVGDQSPIRGYIRFSSDRGVSWTTVFTQGGLYFDCITINGSTSYVGGGSVGGDAVVYKSTDGLSWTPVNNGLPTGSNRIVTSLSVDPTNASIAYAGTNVGIYKTVNGGTNWTLTSTGIAEVFSVLIHPKNTSVIYVASNNPNALVHRTTDNGTTWAIVASGLPAAKVNDITCDFQDPNVIYATTDEGVYRVAHRWTGTLAMNTSFGSGQTYLVEGTLTVPSGKTLTVAAGSRLEFIDNGKLDVLGTLAVNGTASTHSTFTRNGSSGAWAGIVVSGSANVSYADISYATTGIKVQSLSSPFSMTGGSTNNCTQGINIGSGASTISSVTFSGCGTGIYTKAKYAVTANLCTFTNCNIGIELLGQTPQYIRNILSCTFNNILGVGISINSFSNVLMQGNTIAGPGGDKDGVVLVGSSPIMRSNTIQQFKFGLLCTNASNPSLENMFQPGNNIIKNNTTGVTCEHHSNALLGDIEDEYDPGGQNSIFSNTEHDVVVSDTSYVFGENNWYGSRDYPPGVFSVLANSTFDFDPWLEDDPNQGSSPIIKHRPPSSQSITLMRQALRERLEGRYADAATTLRGIIASGDSPSREKKWAVSQLLIIAQLAPSQQLSQYLTNAIDNHPALARVIRTMLPSVLLAENRNTQALAAMDNNIQNYPNSGAQRSALYMKFLYELYTDDDATAAQALLGSLVANYPQCAEKRLAVIQFANHQALSTPSTSEAFSKQAAGSANEPAKEFRLSQNYPNPFNPVTTIKFDNANDVHVSLKIFDMIGREVYSLVDDNKRAGSYEVPFDGTKLASGVYIYRLSAGSFTETRKMVLLK